MFQPDSQIRQDYAWYEEHVGPTLTGDLLIEFPITEGDDPLRRLELVKQAHLCAHKMPSVEGVLSAVSFMPAIPKRRTLGTTAVRGAIRKLIRDPKSSVGKLNLIARDADSEIWRISLRMPQQHEENFADSIHQIEADIRTAIAGADIQAEVTLTGHIAIIHKAQEVLLRDLFRSFLFAFAIVAIVMMVVLRSVIGGLLAMIPNLFPTVTLFGMMGLVESPLDIGSVMTASVALGIAVDDTVHLLSRFGSRRARGFGKIRSSFGAISQCGWAMFQTTMVCGLSLMAYWFSDFVPTSRFALLMFGLLLAALIGDIFLLPGMMASRLGNWLSKSIDADASKVLFKDQPSNQRLVDRRRLPTGWRRLRRRRLDAHQKEPVER